MWKIIANLFKHNESPELKSAIQNGGFLVDVRTPAEFDAGHVQGSVNIPLDKITQHLNDFINKKQIIVFCETGRRSGQAKTILKRSGISSVINGGSWSDINKLVPK